MHNYTRSIRRFVSVCISIGTLAVYAPSSLPIAIQASDYARMYITLLYHNKSALDPELAPTSDSAQVAEDGAPASDDQDIVFDLEDSALFADHEPHFSETQPRSTSPSRWDYARSCALYMAGQALLAYDWALRKLKQLPL